MSYYGHFMQSNHNFSDNWSLTPCLNKSEKINKDINRILFYEINKINDLSIMREKLGNKAMGNTKGFSIISSLYNDMDFLEKIYCFRDCTQVRGFLEQNSFIVSFLFDVYINIKKHFEYINLFCEVIPDSEKENSNKLAIFIAVKDEPLEAFKKLRNFDKIWWLKNLDQARNKIFIHLELE